MRTRDREQQQREARSAATPGVRRATRRPRGPRWDQVLPPLVWEAPPADPAQGPVLRLAHAPPEPLFQVVEGGTAATSWEGQIRDVTEQEAGPLLRYTPPTHGCPWTVQALAVALAAQCAEGRGTLVLHEWSRGLPTFSAAFVANGEQVLCWWSSDAARATPVDPVAYRQAGLAWLRARGAVPSRLTRQGVVRGDP